MQRSKATLKVETLTLSLTVLEGVSFEGDQITLLNDILLLRVERVYQNLCALRAELSILNIQVRAAYRHFMHNAYEETERKLECDCDE